LKKNKRDRRNHRDREIAFKVFPRFIPLAIKLGFVYLSFKRKAKKAGKVFKKELIAGGIDKKTAELLTEDYLKTSHFLRQFDFSDMVKD
jgi:hypothetical protein